MKTTRMRTGQRTMVTTNRDRVGWECPRRARRNGIERSWNRVTLKRKSLLRGRRVSSRRSSATTDGLRDNLSCLRQSVPGRYFVRDPMWNSNPSPPDSLAPPAVPLEALEAVRTATNGQIAEVSRRTKALGTLLHIVEYAAWHALYFEDQFFRYQGEDRPKDHFVTVRRDMVRPLAEGVVWLDSWVRSAYIELLEHDKARDSDVIARAWLAEPVLNWADCHGTPVDVAFRHASAVRDRVLGFLAMEPSAHDLQTQTWVEFRPEDGDALWTASGERDFTPVPIEPLARRVGRIIYGMSDLQSWAKNGGSYLWGQLYANFERLRLRLNIEPEGALEVPWHLTAMAMLLSSPQMSVADVAKAVGKNPGSLYRHPDIRKALDSRAGVGLRFGRGPRKGAFDPRTEQSDALADESDS